MMRERERERERERGRRERMREISNLVGGNNSRAPPASRLRFSTDSGISCRSERERTNGERERERERNEP